MIFWIFGTGLINWGFSIFHKKLGGWIFGIYAGWAVEIVFGLAAILIGKTADLLTGAVNGIRPGRDKERKPIRSRKGGTDIGFIMKNLVLPLTVGIIFLGAVIWLTTWIG